MHRLDLSLYSHPEEFWGNRVINHVNSKGKCHLPEAHRRFEPAMLHHAGQQVQHTTELFPPPSKQLEMIFFFIKRDSKPLSTLLTKDNKIHNYEP